MLDSREGVNQMRDKGYRNLNNSQLNNIRGGETKVMKKIINALLAFVLVFALAVPAMAATSNDVAGTEYEDAVAKLSALGVLDGYGDGTFRPANDITRAEFAKIVVVATGNEDAANLLKGTTPFSDVAASAWYSGYVSAATSFGYVKGYSDGTFHPEQNITGQEVVTVLLRALGYNDNLPGAWPYDYLIKASKLGIIDGTNFSAGVNANRGLVAQLTAATLEETLVSYDSEDNIFNKVKDADGNVLAFIDEKLGAEFSEAIVTAPSLNADGEINLDASDVAFADDAYVGSWALGENVRYLLNGDNEITYIASAQDASDVVTDVTKVVIDETSNSLTLDDDDSTVIDFVYTGATLYKNGSDVTAELTYTINAGASVKVFLNADGDARFVVAEDLNSPVYAVKTTKATNYRDARLYYTNELTFVNVVKDADITLNGEVAELADITEDALVYIGENLDGKATIIKAYNEELTGTVTSFRKGSVNKIYIDGTAFETTLNASDVIVGDEYTVVFDKDGKVVQATAVTAAASTTFDAAISEVKDDVVIKTDDDEFVTVDKITVVNTKGEEVVYYSDGSYMTLTTTSAGAFGKFTLDDDGYVKGFVAATTGDGPIVTDGINGSKVTVNDSVYGNTTYVVTSDTVIFDVHDPANAAPVKVSLDDLQAGFALRYTVDGFNFEYILVDSNTGVGSKLDPVSGLFVESYEVVTTDGTDKYVVLNVDGVEEVHAFDGTVATTIAANDLVTLSDAGNGTYDTATETTDVYAELVAGDSNTFAAAASYDGNFTTSDDDYVLTADTLVYLVDADGNVVLGDASDVFALDRSDAAVSFALVASSDSLGAYTIVDAIVIYE